MDRIETLLEFAGLHTFSFFKFLRDYQLISHPFKPQFASGGTSVLKCLEVLQYDWGDIGSPTQTYICHEACLMYLTEAWPLLAEVVLKGSLASFRDMAA